ncbi:hypothetical protein PGSY75_0210800 [Plasmodium gaboni]|uniref:Uncharacterized protein n=1 Tax=Plasmodium gaboni TaxID=647221 RepID=A0A151LWI3_9APIC|nr:hypothetical protein PGSY75_0210800 [Plasmodium gaboni]KYO03541.1 hypothetical protein PGSY75_0210800 [Plasmodium gaboni]SOV10384.1 conserved Plasmodium protein, unknown function [Plasmodium gaboni]
MKISFLFKLVCIYIVIIFSFQDVRCLKPKEIVRCFNPFVRTKTIKKKVQPNFLKRIALNLKIPQTINLIRGKYNLLHEIYVNKKKHIFNVIYKDIITNNKKRFLNMLNNIVKKQRSINIPLFFNKTMHSFHSNFIYYYTYFYILRTNFYLRTLKKFHNVLIGKFKINILNKVIKSLSAFDNMFLWNSGRISKSLNKYILKCERKLNRVADECFLNDPLCKNNTSVRRKKRSWFYNNDNFNPYNYSNDQNETKKEKFYVSAFKVLPLFFYNVFNINFYIKTIKKIRNSIHTNIRLYLLKDYINDQNSIKAIFYTYKTFFQLSLEKNIVSLFRVFQDKMSIEQKFETTLINKMEKQLKIKLPNIGITNITNLSVILFKLFANKITQVVFYLILVYIKQFLYARRKFLKDIYSFPFY